VDAETTKNCLPQQVSRVSQGNLKIGVAFGPRLR